MAFLDVIRNFFVPAAGRRITVIEPAPPTTYTVCQLRTANVDEVLRLNYRCFENGENYTKYTFSYLLTQPNSLCFQIVTAAGRMAGFICVLIQEDGTGHITTIGVAPEHRRRGLGERLLDHLDKELLERGIGSVMLEVRMSNVAAQSFYKSCGFSVVQKLHKYYSNGEDGFMMVKAVLPPLRAEA